MRKKPFTPNKKTKLDIFSMENAKEVFRNPDSKSLLDLVFFFFFEFSVSIQLSKIFDVHVSQCSAKVILFSFWLLKFGKKKKKIFAI
jgi:hypothetical protein